MGLVVTKSVSGVSHKARLKSSSSATETSLKIEISAIASLDNSDTFQKANNKGADQTVPMRRVVCTFDVHKPLKIDFLALRPIYNAYLSHDVASGCEITPCNKIDNRFSGNVLMSITALST